MVSPETRLLGSPSSKAALAAISKVQRLVFRIPTPSGSDGASPSRSQGLGALFIEGGAGALWARGARLKSTQAPLVEVVDGVPDRLGAASQTPSDLGRGLSTRTCQKNLASTQNKGVFGAQPCF